MKFLADFHIHSKYSMATSSEGDLPHLWLWSGIKGLNVVATGDFTHPKWLSEIKDHLRPDGKGLFTLEDEACKKILTTSGDMGFPVGHELRFILSTEISSVYKKGGKTRKVHNIVCFDTIEACQKLSKKLALIGNITYDGRPMLGLDAKDLLALCLEISPECMFIPAHIWTPWFSVLGSKSGFDSIDECFEDLTPEITALETGLSSDPSMNWMISSLDRFSLVSNSDAHSPQNLGREANIFNTELSFQAMRNHLRMQTPGFEGTIEFFPEEGKYHNDGHRTCGINITPDESIRTNNMCPKCGQPLTIGVLHRVFELADRKDGNKPHNAKPYRSLVPLKQLIAHAYATSPTSKKADEIYFRMIKRIGPEFHTLLDADLDDIQKHAGTLMTECIRRVRAGDVTRIPGFDGEFGKISLFTDVERDSLLSQDSLLKDLKENRQEKKSKGTVQKISKPKASISSKDGDRELDPEQGKVVFSEHWPIIVSAGPGTGKTFTLTEKAKQELAKGMKICAITFTRKSAEELARRLGEKSLWTGTIHAIALDILKQSPLKNSRLIAPTESLALLRNVLHSDSPATDYDMICKSTSKDKKENDGIYARYKEYLSENNLLDFNSLIDQATQLIQEDSKTRAFLQNKTDLLFVDEFQDVDADQYIFIKTFAQVLSNKIFVIGDADQSIYGFRGSLQNSITQLASDFPSAKTYYLRNNHRSASSLVQASNYLISNMEKGIPMNRQSGKVYLSHLTTDQEEAIHIAKRISELIGGKEMLEAQRSRQKGKEFSFSDIAILCRKRSLFRKISDALQKEGIPFRTRGPDFFNLSEVQSIFLLIQFLIQPDQVSMLEKPQQNGYPWDPEVLLEKRDKYLADAHLFLKDLGQHFERQILVEIASLLQPKSNLESLLDILKFSQEDEIEIEQKTERCETVRLLTIHASKGLEFPVVFIPACEEGIIPSSIDETEEERRIFYVAFTRAKEEVYLSTARFRNLFGTQTTMEPSRFLKDLNMSFSEVPVTKRREKNPQLDLFT